MYLASLSNGTPPSVPADSIVALIKSIPTSISDFANDMVAATTGTSLAAQALSNFLATPFAISTVFSLTNDATSALRATGLLTPSLAASTLASLVIPGVNMNADTVADGETFTGLNGNIITVNKPLDSSQATSITTTINGQQLTFPISPTSTSINGKLGLT
jgi:hypothetical protein